MINVVAMIMLNEKKQVLLTLRYRQEGNVWEFPGGKIEPGETLSHALRREIKEELSIHIQVDQSLGSCETKYLNKDFKIHFLLSFYQGQKIILTEHLDYQWVELAKVKTMKMSVNNLEFFKSVQEKLEKLDQGVIKR